MMCASVRQQMILGVNDYLAVDRTQWMQNWPGQIVLNGSQVHEWYMRASLTPDLLMQCHYNREGHLLMEH